MLPSYSWHGPSALTAHTKRSLSWLAGSNNGYFDALQPTDGLKTRVHLPDLASLWACTLLAAPRAPTPLASQLSLCALQRIDTLHEQLLHKQYTCPFIVAALPNQAVATAAADGLESSQAQAAGTASHIAAATGTDQRCGVLDDVSAGAKVLEVELTQLSDQVLQHATLLLKLSTGRSAALQAPSQELLPGHHSRAGLQTEFWRIMSPLVPTLATHASQISLQSFTEQLISRAVPDALLTPEQTQALPKEAASAAASFDESPAEASFRVLRQSTFLEQPQLQRTWLLALQKELSTVLSQLACLSQAGTVTEHEASAQGRQSGKKHQSCKNRQSASELVAVDDASERLRHTGTAPATALSLRQQLAQTLQLVTKHLAGSKSADATQASLHRETSSSSSKASSRSRKRKQAEFSASGLGFSKLLSHVTGVLQHIALMPLALLSPDSANLLAQLLLQVQLWLARAAIAAAAAEAMAVDAVRTVTQAMLSSQQSLARCFQYSSNAAAALLLQAGPQLWQWLPAAVELVMQIQTLGSSARKLSVSQSAQPQTGNRTPVLPIAQGGLSSQTSKAAMAGPLSGSALSMLAEASACMRCLACFCFGVRQTAGTATAAATAGNAADAVEGLERFQSWLATQIKV